MKQTPKLFSAIAIFVLSLSACATAAAPAAQPVPQSAAKPTDAPKMASDVMTKTEAMAGDVMTKTEAMAGDAMAMPAWQTLELIDVKSGKAFKLADYHGKTVFVELMATWCPNCKKQLGYVNAAKKKLANDNIVYVALSVESDLAPAKLAKYAKDTKYDLQFAVLNADGLKAFSDAFGRSALNPPSTPHFIIRPDGTYTELATGFETAAALETNLSAIK